MKYGIKDGSFPLSFELWKEMYHERENGKEI